MAKKIQLQDANGNTLHPLTLGECVVMDNGENLDTLMSKSQMFTPTITQNKSMFKVGTGVDVDYSANVKDGAYESLVFKGKSLVNLLTKTIDTTWNLNLENWSIVSTTLSDYVLKPNTTYSVIVYVTEKTCPDRDDLFWVGDVDGKKDKVTHDIVRKNVSLGANVFVINTVPDFSSITSAYRGGINFQGSKFVEGTLKWKAIVLEGDWTNKELPPYFTGLCDSKMPILTTTGKNLFDTNNSTDGYGFSEGVILDKSDWFLSNYVRVEPNATYVMSCDGESGKRVQFYDRDKKLVTHNRFENNVILVPNNRNIVYMRTNAPLALKSSLQIEKGGSKTTYENHKSNILRTSEEIVLREVNGVQDTYNALTGEYVQRIKERVFNGSETWVQNGQHTDGSYRHICNTYTDAKTSSNNVLCDKMSFVKVNSSTGEGMTSDIHITFTTTTGKVQIATTKPLSELKTWLSQNPITVQYELVEPVTTIIKPSTMTPFAYQNGHAIVESGFEGQSLLPEIEYSVVTGRTGQVTQNTKVLRKQEQQIIGLEELLLTQVVQMEYERTLLQFDYELQMMMLG